MFLIHLDEPVILFRRNVFNSREAEKNTFFAQAAEQNVSFIQPQSFHESFTQLELSE